VSGAPDILGDPRPGGFPLNEELLRNIEAIKVHETLIERIANAFAAVEFIRGSSEIHSHSRIGVKGRLVRASYEVMDILDFIPGFDSRIDPAGYKRSQIMWRLPQSVGGSGWVDTPTLWQFLGTVLFVIHDDCKLHVEADLNVETGEARLLADLNESATDGISVCHGGTVVPEAAPCCLSNSVELDVCAVVQTVPGPEPALAPKGLDLRELTDRTANTPYSPMGESLSMDKTRARKILSFPVVRNRSVYTFKEWIHSGASAPHTVSGDRLHIPLPHGVVVSKESLDNLARFFQAGLVGGTLRRTRLINTDESLSWTESDGDPSHHCLRLRNRGRNY